MGVGVLAPLQLPAQSQKVGYDKKLRRQALPADIYTALSGLYNTVKKSIPNAIYMMVEDVVTSDSTRAVITLKKPLQQGGVYGNAVAIGNEERPVTKAVTIYRNNCRKVVTTPGYGVRKLDSAYLRLYEEHIDDLATWNKEEEGLEIRQAFMERYGETLQFGDTAAAAVRNFNPNIAVCGLPIRTWKPVFSTNVATYTTNIVNAIVAAGGGSILPTVNQTLNQPNLSNMSNEALARRIPTINIPGLPGGNGYVFTYSELQATYLGDPAWSQRNLGDLYTKITDLPDKVQNWPGVQGAYKDLLLVVDPRQPTLNPTGSSAPFGLSAGYMWPGDIDLRYRDDRDVCDTTFLHGKGSLVNWQAEKLHHIQQTDDYGAIVGHGTARVYGVQSCWFDQQVPNMGSVEYYGGILGLCRLPDYV